MKGRGDRPVRVGERIREELSLLLLRKVNDPGLAPVTVTEVVESSDLGETPRGESGFGSSGLR